ncbi:MAG: MGMT family protein [Clostridiales bacterium]|nr:MGMT family protein [Eubacterium sp.]MDD5994882.1 MGMT family protein [Clostridiales bacterium]MDD7348884.1 MGMT family protein [Clostridiales bacterium]MDY3773661.1 MGMT family protein [Eubacterium sp.]
MEKQVYEFLRTIPKGKVVTYGQIAEYLGNKKLARTVGNILHKNPDGDKYPCYKVVNSKGYLSKNYSFGGIKKQKEKLEADGILVTNYKVDLEKYRL